MARPGRFERPTSGSGDQRSIQLSYGRAVAFRQRNALNSFYLLSREKAFAGSCGKPTGFQEDGQSQPLARSLICFASFSISSALRISSRESTVAESVLSACFLSSDANSYSL